MSKTVEADQWLPGDEEKGRNGLQRDMRKRCGGDGYVHYPCCIHRSKSTKLHILIYADYCM